MASREISRSRGWSARAVRASSTPSSVRVSVVGDGTDEGDRPGDAAQVAEAHPHAHRAPGAPGGPQPGGHPVGEVAQGASEQLIGGLPVSEGGLGTHRRGPAPGLDGAGIGVDREGPEPGAGGPGRGGGAARRAGPRPADRPCGSRPRPACARWRDRHPRGAGPAAGRGRPARCPPRRPPGRRAWPPARPPWPGASWWPRRSRAGARPPPAPADGRGRRCAPAARERWTEPATSAKASSMEMRSTSGVTSCSTAMAASPRRR